MKLHLPEKRSGFQILIAVTVAVALIASAGIAALGGLFSGFSSSSGGNTPIRSVEPSQMDSYNGFTNVCDYGAVPNDDKDDTDAFLAALGTGMNLYVPAGSYHVEKTIVLNGSQIAGSAPNNTSIESTGSDPILELKNGADASRLTLRFAKVGDKEKIGKKIGVLLSSAEEGAIDFYLHDLVFDNVGTAIYSEFKGTVNNETFENIRINRFSGAGIVLKNADRYNTCLRMVYLSGAKKAECGVWLENADSAALEQVIVQNASVKEGITLKNCLGFTLRTASFDGVTADELVKLSGSVGSVGSLFDRASSGNAIRVCDMNKEATLKVDSVAISDLTEKQAFQLIAADSLKAKMTVDVDVCTHHNVAKAYQNFPCGKDKNLVVNRIVK